MRISYIPKSKIWGKLVQIDNAYFSTVTLVETCIQEAVVYFSINTLTVQMYLVHRNEFWEYIF